MFAFIPNIYIFYNLITIYASNNKRYQYSRATLLKLADSDTKLSPVLEQIENI
jgi:hypothetical protein